MWLWFTQDAYRFVRWSRMGVFNGIFAELVDRGYDVDWLSDALKDKGIQPCILPKKNHKVDIPYDKTLYKQRHKIENMFGRLKD